MTDTDTSDNDEEKPDWKTKPYSELGPEELEKRRALRKKEKERERQQYLDSRPDNPYENSPAKKADVVPPIDGRQPETVSWIAESRDDDSDTDSDTQDMTNETPLTERSAADLVDPQVLGHMPQGRENTLLSADRHQAAQTAQGFAGSLAAPHRFNEKERKGDAIVERFMQFLSDDILPATCADVVAEEIILRYGDEMDSEGKRKLRTLGEKAVLSAASHAEDSERDKPYHGQFRGGNLHTIEYMDLNSAEQREFIREKARRIPVDSE